MGSGDRGHSCPLIFFVPTDMRRTRMSAVQVRTPAPSPYAKPLPPAGKVKTLTASATHSLTEPPLSTLGAGKSTPTVTLSTLKPDPAPAAPAAIRATAPPHA